LYGASWALVAHLSLASFSGLPYSTRPTPSCMCSVLLLVV
jgi:hypothetical protein